MKKKLGKLELSKQTVKNLHVRTAMRAGDPTIGSACAPATWQCYNSGGLTCACFNLVDWAVYKTEPVYGPSARSC